MSGSLRGSPLGGGRSSRVEPEEVPAVHVLAGRAGWPRLKIDPGRTISGGSGAWHKFFSKAPVEDLALAEAALRTMKEGT